MEYKSLDRITNQYPADEMGLYKSDLVEQTPSNIRLLGKYIKNYADYPIVDYKNITPVANTSFRFILEMNPGRYYTSQPFYDRLKQAYEEKNPFFNMGTVPKVKLDYNFLRNYKNKNKFKITEKYCEARVLTSIDNETEMCYHIDWMVSKQADRIEIRPVSELGTYEVFHDPAGDYALGAKDEYDAMLEGDPDPEGYDAQIVLEKYDLSLPKDAKVTINSPSPSNLNPVEELVRLIANVPVPAGKETYSPLGGSFGLIAGAVIGVALTVLTGGIAAIGITSLLATAGAAAGVAALGGLAGKTLSDVLGPNYSAQGKYWAFIIQRTTTRGIESIQAVFEQERFADEQDWLALMVEVGSQMKCNYTPADVNAALKVVLAMAAGTGNGDGTVRQSDYAYAVNVGNGTRWFRLNAQDKFFIKISY
jgi:hypothetical protein